MFSVFIDSWIVIAFVIGHLWCDRHCDRHCTYRWLHSAKSKSQEEEASFGGRWGRTVGGFVSQNKEIPAGIVTFLMGHDFGGVLGAAEL